MDCTDLKLRRLLLASLATLLAVLLLAAWPMWRWTGAPGIRAMLAAGIIAMAVTGLTGLLVVRVARGRGPLAVGKAFVATGPVRLGVLVGLALLGWWALGLPRVPLLVWTAGLYCVLLLVESWWLYAGLRGARGPDASDRRGA